MLTIQTMSRQAGRHVAGVLLVGTVVGLIGPFGTFVDLPLIHRLPYWLAIAALCWGQWLLLEYWLGRWTRWPDTAVGSAVALLFALPMTAEVTLLNWLWGLAMPQEPAVLMLRIGGTALLLFWLVHLVLRWFGESRGDASPGDGSVAVSAFRRRIPTRIAGELLCLRTEDHYLRIYTTAGDDLVLMRLRDALAELTDEDGLQVHRSFWVAREAVLRTERRGRRRLLILSNGLEVPVSESRLAAVREAGWVR